MENGRILLIAIGLQTLFQTAVLTDCPSGIIYEMFREK